MKSSLKRLALGIAIALFSAKDGLAQKPFPFGPGERLVFSVDYGVINAGTAVMEVVSTTQLRERVCYHIRSTAESNKTFSLFFRVEDLVESFMDVENLYSIRFEKHLREGNFKADQWINFIQDSNLAIYNDGGRFKTLPNTQDMLSVLYYFRTLEFEVGDTVAIPNHADRKNYPLNVIIYRTEVVSVPAGTFVCYVAEPFLKTSAIFKQEGRIIVWLTANQYKIPVKMESKIVIGAITANLVAYKLGTPIIQQGQ